jgi:hypothetical protein
MSADGASQAMPAGERRMNGWRRYYTEFIAFFGGRADFGPHRAMLLRPPSLLPLVIVLMQGAQVVDLSRMVEVVLDHSHHG